MGSFKNWKNVFSNKTEVAENKTNLAISLLIDSSGSVSKQGHKTQLDTIYLIAKTLEETKNKTEVIEFSGNNRHDKNGFKVIKSFNKKVEEGEFKRHFSGGNWLNPPLKQALKDLNGESIKNKFVIVITDGNLTSDGNTISEMNEQINEFKKNNIPVYCILVNPCDSGYKFFDKNIQINDFNKVNTELSILILDIQKKIIKQNTGVY